MTATRPAGLKHWKIDHPRWNRIPDEVRERIVDLALDAPELSPREPATRFTDKESYFVSEASVYRLLLLKTHDLITSPAFVVMKAADEFKDKTTSPNQLWQTDLSEGDRLGLVLLSTIRDDFSRYIIAWKLCTTMKTEDVTNTLQ